MNEPMDPTGPPPAPKKKFPASALILAFVPSILLLMVLPMMARGPRLPSAILSILFVISVICCFTSAARLFRHSTGLAILFGVLFIFLNAAISLFLGCMASLGG